MKKDLKQFVEGHRANFDDQELPAGIWQKLEDRKAEWLPRPQASTPAKTIGLFSTKWVWAAAAAALVCVIGAGIYWGNPGQTPPAASVVQTSPVQKENQAQTLGTENDSAGQVDQVNPSKLIPEAALVQVATAPAQKKSSSSPTIASPSATAILVKFNQNKAQLFQDIVNNESAATRYAAAAFAEKMEKTDPEILQVLIKTMNTDPNTNVRLAAVSSLGKFYREPLVKKALIQSLQEQKDPVVQVALIELLAKVRSQSLAKELEKLVQDIQTPQPVKDQAYSNLLRYQ